MIDSYFDRADVNGDGDVDFPEFAKLYSELKVGRCWLTPRCPRVDPVLTPG